MEVQFRAHAPLVACIVFGIPAITVVAMFAGEHTMLYVGGAIAAFIAALAGSIAWRKRQVHAQMERILRGNDA